MNPPRTPSFGGHFEALIKVTKNAFKTLARWPKYLLTDEELETSLKEAAAIVNMRPLTELSEDPRDLQPLRPSDFLHAPILNIVPNWNEAILSTKLKMETERLKQDLWDRMRTEVLRNLQRVTAHQASRPLTVGELVLIKDQEWRTDKWPLGIITKVHPGNDGTIRVATVRTAKRLEGSENERKETIQSVKNLYRLTEPKALESNRLASPSGKQSTPTVPQQHS